MVFENLQVKKCVSFNVEVLDVVALRILGTTIRHFVRRRDKSELTLCVAEVMATNVIVRTGLDFDILENLADALLGVLIPDELFVAAKGLCLFYANDEHLGVAVNKNIRNLLHNNFSDWVGKESPDGKMTLSFQIVQ
jgi:hypothetical protein